MELLLLNLFRGESNLLIIGLIQTHLLTSPDRNETIYIVVFATIEQRVSRQIPTFMFLCIGLGYIHAIDDLLTDSLSILLMRLLLWGNDVGSALLALSIY
jgi:hypothetical protein